MEEKLNELYVRLKRINEGGGLNRIEAQHEKGKLTARERLHALFDPGSFIEMDAFVESRASGFGMDEAAAPADGVVIGYGTINNRQACAFAQDFTVLGGSLGEMHAAKICRIQDLAMKIGCPCIGLNDSGGARIQEGVDSLAGYGDVFSHNMLASGVIPQISVIMGPCAGGAVYSPALTDFTIMVKKTSYMFITGPQIVQCMTGEEISTEDLGGANVHASVSGCASFVFSTEAETFEGLRKLLSYLPQNNQSPPPVESSDDPVDRLIPDLEKVVPDDSKRAYDVRDVIRPIFDAGSFFEIHEAFAQNIVIGFARLGGGTVGLVANQPQSLAGVLDIDASDKASRFIRFCDSFNIPLVTFVDTGGFLPGSQQERGGIIRHGAKILFAYSEATVPKLTVILRKAYGGAYIAMCSRHLGADQVFAWPSAEIAVMGPEGAATIIFKHEITEAPDPEAAFKAKINEYRTKFANPYQAAARGYVDEVLDPAETRLRLARSLPMLSGKRESRPAKKHGNMPL
jgi:acetyl-CoA carboxylase carboxyltransferase component